jgi:hypothetical protein
MLAEDAQAQPIPVEGERVAQVLDDDLEPRRRLRLDKVRARRQRPRQAGDQPRPAIGAPPDHHRIGVRLLQRPPRAVGADDVAVHHHRQRSRRLHRRDGSPIGDALIELAAGAAMHRDRLDAAPFCAHGQFGCVLAGGVPAQPHLQRHRPPGRPDRRRNQRLRLVQIAHQGRAGQGAGHLLGGATHVEVDDLRARGFRHACALRQPLRLATHQLHHDERQPLPHRRAAHDIGSAARKLGASHHLGRHIGSAQPRQQPAERQVRHASHRRREHAAGDRYVADLKGFGDRRVYRRDRHGRNG